MPWQSLLEGCRQGSVDDAALRESLGGLGADPLGPAIDGLRLLAGAGDPEGGLPDLDGLPDPVGALVSLDALSRHHMLSAVGLEGLARLMHLGSQSRHLGRLAAREAEVLRVLASPIQAARSGAGLLEAARGVAVGPVEDALKALRRWRSAELTRAFYRESMRIAPVSVTTAEVSALASACLQVVLERVRAQIVSKHGDALDASGAPIPMAIIGLGKLGGWELNFSSDVDIVYVYATDEGRVGGTGDQWAVHHFFTRLGKALTAAMEAVTPEGRLWRVDLRLRPGGARGPLVHALAAAEAFYEAWGRTFERAVWLKARHVAGDRATGEALIARLEPFVYRRHLDFSAFEELRAMKGRIDRHAVASMSTSLRARAAAGRQSAGALSGEALSLLGWNVKTGQGGIREIEFVVQALQLIWGGRRPEARNPATLSALEGLMALGLLSTQDVDALSGAYTLFRLCEHRIQMEGERQTHDMPTKLVEVERLARRMGWPEAGAFLKDLAAHRSVVAGIFTRMFRQSDEARARFPAALMAVVDWPELSMEDEGLLGALAALGFDRPRQAAGHLMVLRGRPTTPFSPAASASLASMAPLLMQEVLASADPDLALVHLTTFLTRVGARVVYYQSLIESPSALRLLISLFGSSRYFSQIFVRQPDLFDALLSSGGWGSLSAFASGAVEARSKGALLAALDKALEGIEGQEARLGALRRFKHEHELRVALADMAGLLDQEGIGLMLSDLADVCIEVVQAEAWQELIWKHGEPRNAAGRCSPFCVVALGKHGGRELSYGSDLDVIFVFDEASGRTCGLKPIGNREFFARMARRMIAFLSTQLVAGRLYRVDTRLRPSGRQGTLVVSLESFEGYHARASALWERQALLRSRVVCGIGGLTQAVGEAIEAATLSGEVDAGGLCAQLDEMRARMEAEVASDRARVYNIKAGSGGIVDVEFAVQACQLLWGGRRPELRTPSTFMALRALVKGGWLGGDRAERLLSCYATLRRLESRLRMLEGTGESRVPIADAGGMRRLAKRAGYRGQAPGAELSRDLESVCSEVRAIYTHVVRDSAPFEAEG